MLDSEGNQDKPHSVGCTNACLLVCSSADMAVLSERGCYEKEFSGTRVKEGGTVEASAISL